eukprot:scaffold1564_cov174-Amphora_coffeaeformis.AAC.31
MLWYPHVLVSEASYDGVSVSEARSIYLMSNIVLSACAVFSNGGTCISQSAEVCDCSTAVRDSYKYEGKYCEFKIGTVEEYDSTAFEECPCVNNGECSVNQLGFNPKCKCPPGYSGRFCEFDETVPECNTYCMNGGYCVFGSADNGISSHQVCHCIGGYKGEFCEIDSEPCGEKYCLHGSTCVSEYTGDAFEVKHCDCRSARSARGKRYAGLSCEYEETATCDNTQSIESGLFCVNRGDCRDDVGLPGCECPIEYTGFSCEFYVEKPEIADAPVNDIPECNLDCNGRGVCRHGIKDISGLGDAANAEGLSQTHQNYQHCVCEEGFTGIYCDRAISLCENTDLFCLHGGACRTDELGSPYCDCSSASFNSSVSNFHGSSCEFVISSVCSKGDTDYENLDAFCVNSGICKDSVKIHQGYVVRHPGCNCQDGWTGDHCEILIKATDMRHENDPDTRKELALIFPIVVILLSLAVILLVTIKLISSYRESEKEAPHQFLWVSGARPDVGDDQVINLAPRRDPSFDENEVVAVKMNPNRDPVAHFSANKGINLQMNFGPQLDDDGFQLHDVELL